MSVKPSAQSKAPSVRKILAIAQNISVLDMLKEGKNYTDVGQHYGIKHYINGTFDHCTCVHGLALS